jgi:RNA polymerase sigma factor (sigma-70 family)
VVVPDADLLAQAAQGSREAFAVLYDRHDRRIYDFCLRLTGSPHDAADATQETFLAVLRRVRSGGKPIDDVERYLCTAARHASYRLLERRRRVDLPGELPETPGPEAREGLLEPEQAALIASQQEDVRRANDRLPARYQEVLALREVEGRSYERIGATLGLAENAVAQLIWRARVRLRRELRHGAVASIVPRTEECERALGLIVAQDDGELHDLAEVAWLNAHLDACEGCRLARTALLEVGSSYRVLVLPALLLAGVREQLLGHHAAAVATTAGAAAAGAGGGGWSTATLTRITKLGHLAKGSPLATTGAVAGSAIVLGVGAAVLNGGTASSHEIAATPASRVAPLVAATLGIPRSSAGGGLVSIAATGPAGAGAAARPGAGDGGGLGAARGTFAPARRETRPGAGVDGSRQAGGRRRSASHHSAPSFGNPLGSSFAGDGSHVPRPGVGGSVLGPPGTPPSGTVAPPTIPDPPVWKPPADPPLDGSTPPVPEPPDVTSSPVVDLPPVSPPPVADPPVMDPSPGTDPPSSGPPTQPPPVSSLPTSDPPSSDPSTSYPPPSDPPSSDPSTSYPPPSGPPPSSNPPPSNPPPSDPPPSSNPPPSTPPPSNPSPSDGPPSGSGGDPCHSGLGHHLPRPGRTHRRDPR